MTVEYVEKVYTAYSKFYDRVFGKVFHNGREIAPSLLELNQGQHLLEVGVGTGLSLPLLPKDIKITGIDLSPGMLNKAKERVDALGYDHVDLQVMDATYLDFPDNSFDAVLAAYFISTVPEPVKVIHELMRVCKPGGYILFANHFRHDNRLVAKVEKSLSPLFYRVGFRTDLHPYELMSEAGLDIETVVPLDFLSHWKAVRCINPAKPEQEATAQEATTQKTTTKAQKTAAKTQTKKRPRKTQETPVQQVSA